MDDVKPEEVAPEPEPATEQRPPRPTWEYKSEFRIVTEMKIVIHKTIEVSEAELSGLRRKLDKITYGS